MQRKQVQVAVERPACPRIGDGAQAHVGERSSHRFAADLNSIVSAAHKLPAEVAPPPRVWRSLRLQLEKEGIFSACPKKTLEGRVRTPAFRNYKEQRAAIYPSDGKTVQALLQTADRELYGMKSRDAEQRSLLVAV
jgi:hypothetical protein